MMECEHGFEFCFKEHPEHDCLTREHDPETWCPDCRKKEPSP